MSVSHRLAVWPQLVAISLIGLGAASCSSDSGRFSDIFGTSSSSSSHSDVTGSIAPGTSAGHVESKPLPHLASADDGNSGGGRGMGSYQPGTDVTGSLPAPPPPPTWTWEGGTPVTVAPGETLDMIARQHGVPVSAIMDTNNISNPASVHAGQHLVIPRYRPSAAALSPPATRMASTSPSVPPAPVGAPRTALAPITGMHVVAPGETLHSIARLYGKSVLALAKANNIAPDTMVKVGERIVIPDLRGPAQTSSIAPPATQPSGPSLAVAESPHSARVATPTATSDVQQNDAVKTAEPAGGLPTFRWPVRGRIIAAFGPKPNGLQNDGINLAVPEGTPIKAAEDGVVAYAGNELKGYGNLVLVRHADGFVTAYAHASEILVKRGETVKRGQVIAKSGETGNVTSPQLHFEIRKGATPVDPAQYLSGA
jgi:murein DD-endopeptidase MepM/ murein hydrolase activator NlpD